MNRTRTSIAVVTAAMCATVLVSNAGAETTTPEAPATETTPETPTPTETTETTEAVVTETVTITPTVTTTVPKPTGTTTTPTTPEKKSDTRSILQAFSSRDFTDVSTPAVILFVLGIITALLNLAMRIDPAQVQATVDQVRAQLPF